MYTFLSFLVTTFTIISINVNTAKNSPNKYKYIVNSLNENPVLWFIRYKEHTPPKFNTKYSPIVRMNNIELISLK